MQLLRDGGALPGDSKFYSTFTGPAVYTDTDKFQKVAFDDVGGKDRHALKANDGWIAMIQHYFVSAFVPPENAPREIFTKKLATNLYSIGTVQQLGAVAPGATVSNTAPSSLCSVRQ